MDLFHISPTRNVLMNFFSEERKLSHIKVNYYFHQYSDKRNKIFLKSFLIKLAEMKVQALFLQIVSGQVL